MGPNDIQLWFRKAIHENWLPNATRQCKRGYEPSWDFGATIKMQSEEMLHGYVDTHCYPPLQLLVLFLLLSSSRTHKTLSRLVDLGTVFLHREKSERRGERCEVRGNRPGAKMKQQLRLSCPITIRCFASSSI